MLASLSAQQSSEWDVRAYLLICHPRRSIKSNQTTQHSSLSLSLSLSCSVRSLLRVVRQENLSWPVLISIICNCLVSCVTGSVRECQSQIWRLIDSLVSQHGVSGLPGVYMNLPLYLTFCHINTAVITKRKLDSSSGSNTDKYSFISHPAPLGVFDIISGWQWFDQCMSIIINYLDGY